MIIDVPPSLIPVLKDRWVVFSFRPLVIKLLRIFVYRFLDKHKFSFLWDKCPKGQLLGSVVSTFSYIRNFPTLSGVAEPFYISTSRVSLMSFSSSSPTFGGITLFLNFSHLNSCV